MTKWYPLVLFLLIQCATPGPHNLTCLYLGGRHGLRGTAGFISGALCTVFLKALLCGLLTLALERLLPTASRWIRWLGAAYILYLGVNMILSGRREEGDSAPSADPGWKSGVVLQILSAKSWIMCLSLYASFGAQIGSSVGTMLGICFLLVLISLLMSLVWTLAGVFLRDIIKRHRTIFNTVMGLALIYCAFMAIK